MNIIIYGSDKCFNTKKAQRYFKERRIGFQYVDLFRYGLSPREFETVAAQAGLDAMINTGSREYEKLFIKYLTPDAVKEKLMENPRLLNTPIVRNGKTASTVGYCPEVWAAWQ